MYGVQKPPPSTTVMLSLAAFTGHEVGDNSNRYLANLRHQPEPRIALLISFPNSVRVHLLRTYAST